MLWDREQANAISVEITDAAQAVAARHGLTVQRRKAHYGDDLEIVLRVSKVAVNEAGVNVLSREAQNLNRWALSYGLPEDALGKAFRSGGKAFILTGLDPAKRKYPVLARCEDDGRSYRFTPAHVKGLLMLAERGL